MSADPPTHLSPDDLVRLRWQLDRAARAQQMLQQAEQMGQRARTMLAGLEELGMFLGDTYDFDPVTTEVNRETGEIQRNPPAD